MNDGTTLAHEDDADAGDVTAQHRSQPEFDFDDEAAPTVSVAAPAQSVSRPAPSQPAEAAAAPAQAAAHDASFAHTPIEHDVERVSPAPETNVESASGGDEGEAIAPGSWASAPVANEAPADVAEEEVTSPAASAAAFVTSDVDATEPAPAPAEAPVADESNDTQLAVEEAAPTGTAPAAPGLFDAMPPEDPAQAAAEAARDARNA
jgi:ribonuclease E